MSKQGVITIIDEFSASGQDQLENVCKRWKQFVSAAIKAFKRAARWVRVE